jgi:hypothetical protein
MSHCLNHLSSWCFSDSKFKSGRTSISREKLVLSSIQYPSITFCPHFKDMANIHDKILTRATPGSCYNICGAGELRKKKLLVGYKKTNLHGISMF